MQIFWNGIVRNEAARIERMLRTIDPYIAGAIVLDTGSTDATVEKIANFFIDNGKPCIVRKGVFENWEQARNDALTLARRSDAPWDYIFLVDADMELVVTDPNWVAEIKDALCYEMFQKAGTLSYTNARLISRRATGIYKGVTHEYLDIPVGGRINGAHFIDHADGANRPNKHIRDAELLRGGLEKEPENARYWYYLGQALRDDGKFKEAIPAFEACLKYTNWDEEKYIARTSLAHCHLELGDRGSFYRETLDAFQERPTRAEALYDLTRHFRERGQNHLALIFAEYGLTIPKSNDILFVNEFPYEHGFKEEYAICGYYDPARRQNAAQLTNELSLDVKVPEGSRLMARYNMIWHLHTLKDYCPSFEAEQIAFEPPENWVAMNPSLSQEGDLSVRCVNYRITPWGSYEIRHLENGSVNRENPIHTRNFVRDHGLWREVIPPPYEKKYDLVIGAEDMRLFRWSGELWSLSNFRDQKESGACVQHLARLAENDKDMTYDMVDLRAVEPQDFPATYSEKNWMPWPRATQYPPIKDGKLWLVHRLGVYLDAYGSTIHKSPTLKIDVGRLSGGGCVVDIGNDHALAIVHESQILPNEEYNRYYYHRFVLLKSNGDPVAVSRPFIFHDKVIEFAAGLAVIGDDVWISYGREDKEAWLATVKLSEVKRMVGL